MKSNSSRLRQRNEGQFTTTGTYSDCYGYNYPGNGVEMYWSHNNSGVAWAEQISTGNSRTHGVNPGSTSDWSDYWVQMYDNDGMDCYPWGGWGYNEQPETVFSISVSLSPASVSPGGQTTVTVSTNPSVSGQSLSMSLSEVANSGGHQHTGRPLGNFGTTSGATNASGQFQTTYTASAFGGLEMISATVGGTTASASLAVAVNGLTALGAGNNYSLVGSTPSHPSNHFGTATANANLVSIANQYASQYPGSSLNYNDQSLSQGGLFDIAATWTTPHSEHRFGLNCDVSKSNVPSDRWGNLEDIFATTGSPNFLDEGNHWHLRF